MDYNLPGGASTSTATQQLPGNQIHEVTFKGVETKTIESKTGEKFDIISIKFANDSGNFEDTLFELKKGDNERKKNNFGYENPSALEELQFKAKHLLAAVAPKVAAQIEEKGGLKIGSWDAFGKFLVKHANVGIGAQTQIKLVERTDAKGIKRINFPSFVLGVNKKNEVYPKTNFIGSKLVWTAKEKERMETTATAKPTDPAAFMSGNTSGAKPELELDLDLDLA